MNDLRRKKLITRTSFAYDIRNKQAVHEIVEHLSHLMTKCDHIKANLDGLAEHMGKVAQVYSQGHEIAGACNNMEKVIDMTASLTRSLFTSYCKSMDMVDRLFQNEPLSRLYVDCKKGVEGLNASNVAVLGGYSKRINDELVGEGYRI